MGRDFLVADALMVKFRSLVTAAAFLLVACGLVAVGSFMAARKIQSSEIIVLADSPFNGQSLVTAELPTAPDVKRSASLVFVGDIMLDRHVLERINQTKDDTYPFHKIMTDARFTSADVQIANLEGPITNVRRPPVKSIDFAFDPRFAVVLRQIGFDAVSQANNHTFDQGRAGQEDSRHFLQDAGIEVFGDELEENNASLATLFVHGRRVSLVGFNSVSDMVDRKSAADVMNKARQDADSVVVFMHWGEEYRDHPTRSQEEFGRWLIDNGASIVIGGHPHWTEGIALYKGKPIVYSLGNFVFDQDWSKETMQGLAVKVLLSDEETQIELNPIQIDKSQPHFVDGAEREDRLREIASLSDTALTSQILQGHIILPFSQP
ncbi:CapA family protein [Patescibacteria group bacterium]|nr:CapA family protein [Patescibacteria group bacterium]MBU1034265.1 CapA family protein [Patescibacteria group bacterium]MBU1630122.1 CapA family protein [Patescibacteria group bacterium]MBU1908200.1 CapA family protein [Patescibacteria group bacterium]